MPKNVFLWVLGNKTGIRLYIKISLKTEPKTLSAQLLCVHLVYAHTSF